MTADTCRPPCILVGGPEDDDDRVCTWACDDRHTAGDCQAGYNCTWIENAGVCIDNGHLRPCPTLDEEGCQAASSYCDWADDECCPEDSHQACDSYVQRALCPECSRCQWDDVLGCKSLNCSAYNFDQGDCDLASNCGWDETDSHCYLNDTSLACTSISVADCPPRCYQDVDAGVCKEKTCAQIDIDHCDSAPDCQLVSRHCFQKKSCEQQTENNCDALRCQVINHQCK